MSPRVGVLTLFPSELKGMGGNQAVHLDPNLLGVLVIAPFALFGAAAIVFMVGKMRRL